MVPFSTRIQNLVNTKRLGRLSSTVAYNTEEIDKARPHLRVVMGASRYTLHKHGMGALDFSHNVLGVNQMRALLNSGPSNTQSWAQFVYQFENQTALDRPLRVGQKLDSSKTGKTLESKDDGLSHRIYFILDNTKSYAKEIVFTQYDLNAKYGMKLIYTFKWDASRLAFINT